MLQLHLINRMHLCNAIMHLCFFLRLVRAGKQQVTRGEIMMQVWLKLQQNSSKIASPQTFSALAYFARSFFITRLCVKSGYFTIWGSSPRQFHDEPCSKLDRRKNEITNSLHVALTSDVVHVLVFSNRPVQPVQSVKKPFEGAQTSGWRPPWGPRLPASAPKVETRTGTKIPHVGTHRFRVSVASQSPGANFFLPKKPFDLGETWRTKLRKIPVLQARFWHLPNPAEGFMTCSFIFVPDQIFKSKLGPYIHSLWRHAACSTPTCSGVSETPLKYSQRLLPLEVNPSVASWSWSQEATDHSVSAHMNSWAKWWCCDDFLL